MFYKLDENKNVVKSSLEEWSNFIGANLPTNFTHVGDDKINGYRISTVFIGLCNGWGKDDKHPLVFETMIFKNDQSVYQKNYINWLEAEQGHKIALEFAKNGMLYP